MRCGVEGWAWCGWMGTIEVKVKMKCVEGWEATINMKYHL